MASDREAESVYNEFCVRGTPDELLNSKYGDLVVMSVSAQKTISGVKKGHATVYIVCCVALLLETFKDVTPKERLLSILRK